MATKLKPQYYIPRSENDTSRFKKDGDDGGEYTVEAVEAMLEPEGLICSTNQDPEPVFSDKALIVMAIFESFPATAPRIYHWIGTRFESPRFQTPIYMEVIMKILHSDDDDFTSDFFFIGGVPMIYWRHEPGLRHLLSSMIDTDGLGFRPDRHIKHHANKLKTRAALDLDFPISKQSSGEQQLSVSEFPLPVSKGGGRMAHELHASSRGPSYPGPMPGDSAHDMMSKSTGGEDAAMRVLNLRPRPRISTLREFGRHLRAQIRAQGKALEKEEEEREKANNEKKTAEKEASAKANAAKADEGEGPSDTQLSPVAAATPLQASVRRWGKSENSFHLPRIGEVSYHPFESDNYEALRGVSRNDNNHHHTQKRLHDSNHTTGLDDPSPGSGEDIEHYVYSPKDNHVSRSDGIACTVLELLLEPQWASASEGNGLEEPFTEKALIVMAFGHTEIENNTKNWKRATRRISAQNAMQLYHRLPTRLRKRIAFAYRAAAEDLHSSKAAHVHLSFQFVHERPTEPTDGLHQGWRVAKDFHLGRDSISPRFSLAVGASIEQHLLKASKTMSHITRARTDDPERDAQVSIVVSTGTGENRFVTSKSAHQTQEGVEKLRRIPTREHVDAALRSETALLNSTRRTKESRAADRLTVLGIVYMPLSFVTSFFGMGVMELDSGVWTFALVTLWVTLFAYTAHTLLQSGLLRVLGRRVQESPLVSGHSPTMPSRSTAQIVK